MNTNTAVKTLKQYQKWRRDNSDSPHDRVKMPNPEEVGMALDIAIAIMAAEAQKGAR